MEENFKKNTIWNIIGITLNSFNSLFFLIIINRVNGVDVAGVFSFAFSAACLLYAVGIYSGRTYQVSDIKRELNDREYLVHKFYTCIIMMLLAFVFIAIRNYDFEKNIIIILLCFYKCLEAFSDTLYGYLQKNNKLYIVGKSLFFKSLIGIIVFLLVDLITKNIIISCIALLLNSLLFVAFYDAYKSKKYISQESINLKNVNKLFKLGFSVFAFSFLAVFIVNIPKYVIDYLLTDAYQTIFSIIVMPGTVVSLCGQYIMAPMLTNIVDCLDRKAYKEFNSIVNKMVKILLIFALLIEIAAVLLGIPILSFVYAIDLTDYKIDLILIIFGAIMYAVAGIYSTALITMRKNNMQLLIYSIDSIFGLIICYFLIYNFGIHGATYGYLFTMILHVILYIIYYIYEYKKLKDLRLNNN